MLHRLSFEARYLLGRPPWDTGITPPEVTAFLDGRPPGRALDIGCGTGTNAVTMARLGWEVTAIDFSRVALFAARRKARAAGLTIDIRRADAGTLLGLNGPFDFALDIGCYHSLAPAGRAGYAARLPELVAAQGVFILFGFLGGPAEPDWPAQREIENAFEPSFRLERLDHGTTAGRPSAFFTWARRA